MSGLVIEMLGVWGVYSSTGANDQARLPLPGGSDVPLVWVAVGAGFVLWLTGTIIVYAVPSTRITRGPGPETLPPENHEPKPG
jgi:hypothetical protein